MKFIFKYLLRDQLEKTNNLKAKLGLIRYFS